MTPEQINEKVALKVLGWKRVPVPDALKDCGEFGQADCWKDLRGAHWPDVENFSNRLGACELIFKQLRERGYWWEAGTYNRRHKHYCNIGKGAAIWEAEHKELPIAICEAALAVFCYEVD